MSDISLRVIDKNGQEIFHSDKHWLLPLFDLETHIEKNHLDISNAEIHDKIIGKAAAFLILRLGAGRARADIISKLACTVFDQANFPYSFSTLVDRIACQTEQILLDINDPEIAYRILRERVDQKE